MEGKFNLITPNYIVSVHTHSHTNLVSYVVGPPPHTPPCFHHVWNARKSSTEKTSSCVFQYKFNSSSSLLTSLAAQTVWLPFFFNNTTHNSRFGRRTRDAQLLFEAPLSLLLGMEVQCVNASYKCCSVGKDNPLLLVMVAGTGSF